VTLLLRKSRPGAAKQEEAVRRAAAGKRGVPPPLHPNLVR